MDSNLLDYPELAPPTTLPVDPNPIADGAPSGYRPPDLPVYRAQATFLRHLPALLEKYPGKWVAFTEDGFLRIGNTQDEMYRHCLFDLGLPHERFVVRLVEPWGSQVVEY